MAFLINLPTFFRVKCFGPVTSFELFFSVIWFLFCLFSVLFLCITTGLVLHLCLCAGFLVLLSLQFH